MEVNIRKSISRNWLTFNNPIDQLIDVVITMGVWTGLLLIPVFIFPSASGSGNDLHLFWVSVLVFHGILILSVVNTFRFRRLRKRELLIDKSGRNSIETILRQLGWHLSLIHI